MLSCQQDTRELSIIGVIGYYSTSAATFSHDYIIIIAAIISRQHTTKNNNNNSNHTNNDATSRKTRAEMTGEGRNT